MALAPKTRAAQLLNIILVKDVDRLQRIDDYMQGDHDDPYMPEMATHEYKLLAQRCVSNWFPLLVGTPAQACYVDNFRPGRKKQPSTGKALVANESTPEWDHWQFSRLDSRQAAIYRGALTYGHAFGLTERTRDHMVRTKGLSARRTAALYEDPANDDDPLWALTITKMAGEKTPGKARMWDETLEYQVTFKSADPNEITVSAGVPHGASSCPITRFAASIDLDGRTLGVVEPMIPLQNRINQTIFDLLVAQTYASIKVRTVTGMAPPMKMKKVNAGTADEAFVPDLDANGKAQPEPVKNLGSRMLYAANPATKFGTLDETPLSGFIESIDMSIRHLSAISQTPPHYLLGQIANLSAEALQAAEVSLARKIDEFRSGFGESWERVFRLAAELSGVEGVDDYNGEVIWRDMEGRSLAQAADALGKMREQLQVPLEGLWARVPDVTNNELEHWKRLREEENTDQQMVDALFRASGSATTTSQPAVSKEA